MMTRCPDCSTAFLVSPAQIKVRAGKVRCGACDAIFNALDTLVDDSVKVPSAAGHSTNEQHNEPYEELQPVTENISAMSFEASDPAIPADTDAILDAILGNTEKNDTSDSEDKAELDFVIGEPEPKHEQQQPEVSSPLTDYLATAPIPDSTLPARRWPWVLGSAVAALALLLQATYYYRVELSVLRPEFRPLLQAACKPLRCDVPRPRQIDLLSIDTSDLRPDAQQSGRLTLTATLRSKAPYAQEWPLLELTLTDVNDKKLAVKHFAARDYLANNKNLDNIVASGFPANGEIAVNLPLDMGDLSAAGYRLYIFYP